MDTPKCSRVQLGKKRKAATSLEDENADYVTEAKKVVGLIAKLPTEKASILPGQIRLQDTSFCMLPHHLSSVYEVERLS